MADCMTKCIAANDQVSGRVVTQVRVCNAVGLTQQTVDPKINKQVDSGAFETKYSNRFDDPRYYAGDTSS